MTELPTTIDYRTFNFDTLIYNKPRKERGRYLGKVKYKVPGKKNHQRIVIQTPKLKVMKDLEISDDRCSLELQLFNNNINYYQFLMNFDDKNINAAYLNSKNWFGQQFPMDIIDEFYKPFIRLNRNKNPGIKVKIIYGELQNFNLEELKEGNELILWLECMGLRFLNQQFTMVWKAIKAKNVTYQEEELEQDADYYNRDLIDVSEISEALSSSDSEDELEPPLPDVPQDNLFETTEEHVQEQEQEPVLEQESFVEQEPVQNEEQMPLQEGEKLLQEQELIQVQEERDDEEKDNEDGEFEGDLEELVDEKMMKEVEEHINNLEERLEKMEDKTLSEKVQVKNKDIQEQVHEVLSDKEKDNVEMEMEVEVKDDKKKEKKDKKERRKKKIIRYANNRRRIWQ